VRALVGCWWSHVLHGIAAEGEPLRVAAQLEAFRAEIAEMERTSAEEDIDIDLLCEVPEVSVAEEVAP
jgi:hypothetical protein